MQRVGRGQDIALWFNGRAKQVTKSVVHAFRTAAPKARMFVTSDLEEARAAARDLATRPPRLLFCGGGDGTSVVLLNLLREEGATTFPPIGLLKLGTGNGWPRAVHAPGWRTTSKLLRTLPLDAPTRRFDLVEVEGRLCHFTGVGWDAVILHDYVRNLQRRRRQPVVGSFAERLNRGIGGYLYSVARHTVPTQMRQQLKHGRVRVRRENLGARALTVDSHRRAVPVTGKEETLFKGPMSVAAAATEPFWGAGFRAFPFARLVPGRINVRIYERGVLAGLTNIMQLYRGAIGHKGMHDFFLTRARFVFSRPMPFQIAGDVMGPRESLEVAVARQTVQLLDWDDVR